MKNGIISLLLSTLAFASCGKNSNSPAPPPPAPSSFSFTSLKVNGAYSGVNYFNVGGTPVVRLSFSAPIDHASVGNAVTLKSNAGISAAFTATYADQDSTLVIQPSAALQSITKYTLSVTTSLQSQAKGTLQSAIGVNLTTAIDSSDKFPRVSDSVLLDLVQSQTLKYFWDFGHPVSGMARERNTSGDVVTSGGTGFGIMAMIAGVNRNFITRAQGLSRIAQIVAFLTGKATRYHGAFAHWINGASGATVPFSTQDNGGDIVETSYLMQGLLTARQYFNSTADNTEIQLRSDINNLWNAVDYDWYRQNGKNILYWNWSPDYGWAVNVGVRGWNEALITYVLAASATNPIPKSTYDSGWAANGAIRNGGTYYNTVLPLGPAAGGPLFFAHYSFLGLDPNGLTDAYANYWTQNTAHTLINYSYCVQNPQGYNGYSDQCWGLTASDDNITGYGAHSPTSDPGIISPTAAVSSLPYAPVQSMNALRFFYYKLGDKIWGQYGFMDAFNLNNIWFSGSYIAIDQGPQIVMIENYRSGLLWNLFMSCPEVQTNLKRLGFSSPHF